MQKLFATNSRWTDVHPWVEKEIRHDSPQRRGLPAQAGRTVFVVSSTGASSSGSGGGPDGVRPPPSFRWTIPFGILLIAFVAAATVRGHPAPGLHGRSLLVSLALAGFAVGLGGALWMRRTWARPMVVVPGVVVIASSATLIHFQPNGPGFLGVFPTATIAALALPPVWSAVVAVAGAGALAAAWATTPHPHISGIIQVDLGVAAFYGVALIARRFRESNESQARLLVELERSRAAEAMAAALGERQRLAREMHDVLAHTLSGLVLHLEGARLLAERGAADPELKDAIGRAHRLAKTGLSEARRAIGMLRDEELPGPERIPALAAEFEADSGVKCTVWVAGDEGSLSADARLTFFRVAQEALTNVRKHAHPERVEVRVAYDAEGSWLTVEDFGCDGERPPPVEGTGYGLAGMRERAELLGGTLRAGPTARGFTVKLWVPR